MNDIIRVGLQNGQFMDIYQTSSAIKRLPADQMIRDYQLKSSNTPSSIFEDNISKKNGLVYDDIGLFRENNTTVNMYNKEVKGSHLIYGDVVTTSTKKVLEGSPISSSGIFTSRGVSNKLHLYAKYVFINKKYDNDIPMLLRVIGTSKEEVELHSKMITSKGLLQYNYDLLDTSKGYGVMKNRRSNKYEAYFIGLIILLAIVLIIAVAAVEITNAITKMNETVAEEYAYAKAVEAKAEMQKEYVQMVMGQLKERGKILNMMKIRKEWNTTYTGKDGKKHTIHYIEYNDGRLVAVDLDTGKSVVSNKGSLQENKKIIEQILQLEKEEDQGANTNLPNNTIGDINLPQSLNSILKFLLIGGIGAIGIYLTYKITKDKEINKYVKRKINKIT